MTILTKEQNLIMQHVDSLVFENTGIRINDAFIHNINDNGHKWLDIYFVAKDVETDSLFPMKAHIESLQCITFQFVTDEEYENATKS